MGSEWHALNFGGVHRSLARCLQRVGQSRVLFDLQVQGRRAPEGAQDPFAGAEGRKILGMPFMRQHWKKREGQTWGGHPGAQTQALVHTSMNPATSNTKQPVNSSGAAPSSCLLACME